ncbi:MAG: subtype II CRISPR-associated endonuclease Cas1 [Bacteroidetes bacterium GWE2_42_24]|nr:MAG: subtype II CRISPR-associated endonuclease Cas1 [Bacteroidetes bacterium GWE2_42_24]OFY32539.1 MAG: subtype II CRISPR-associated endonuclease Cas1 [Bacteroidetes bacterium GWF2_43_11]
MIKRTLYFGNSGYLHLKNSQLIWEPEPNEEMTPTIPIEDIGMLIIDNARITITHGLMASLLANNCVVIHCDQKHMPAGIFVANEANTLYSQVVKAQLEASIPITKNIWQQIIKSKLKNQAEVLEFTGQSGSKIRQMISEVQSGDAMNIEGRAAAFYFGHLFGSENKFKRRRDGEPPNHLLNYGYAILRAITARGIVGSGLLGVIGIHHRNKYNAWCLADDIMEPYRPWVDRLVIETCATMDEIPEELTPALKKSVLSIPILDVWIEGLRSPLMTAVNRTTSSLARVFQGETRKLLLPTFSE